MIWLVGGTSTSREISSDLTRHGIEHIVTAATPYGGTLYGEGIPVRVGRMKPGEMRVFAAEIGAEAVVDATHPYAVEVSTNTLDLCRELGIPHIRVERRSLEYSGVRRFSTYREAADYLSSRKGSVLVTTGSNNLEEFRKQDLARYYFRVLPVKESIEKVRGIGVSPKNIIGLQGPFSREFNLALIENYGIRYLITKESGDEGGEREKIEACREAGVEVVVIERPKVEYQHIVYEGSRLIEKIEEIRG